MKEFCKDKHYHKLRFKGSRGILRGMADFINSGIDNLHDLVAAGKCFYLAYIDIDYDKQYTIQLEMVLADIISQACASAEPLQLTAWHLSRDDFLIFCRSRRIVEVCHSLLETWFVHVYSQSQIISGKDRIAGGLGLSIAILRHDAGRFINFGDYETNLYALLRQAKMNRGCKYLFQEGNKLTLKFIPAAGKRKTHD